MINLSGKKISFFYELAAQKIFQKAARCKELASANPSRQKAYELLAEIHVQKAAKSLALARSA